MDDFSGKVAVITGAASGIGLALARKAAGLGMSVVMADIDEPALAAAAEGVRSLGTEVRSQRVDVARAEDLDALADLSAQAFGAVHLLVNNAGVASVSSSWEHSVGDWQWVLGVNLWGVIHGIRTFIPRMLAQGDECHVVNTASMAGIVTGGFMPSYYVSKHGVVALTEALYKELEATQGGDRIGVSLLCPGSINTNIRRAELHRNPEFERTTAPPSAGVLDLAQNIKAGLAEGFEPGLVAEMVFAAVRERKFYIFPAQDHYRTAIRIRHEEIQREQNPTSRPLT